MVYFIGSHSLLVNLFPCLQTLHRIFPFICICLSAGARGLGDGKGKPSGHRTPPLGLATDGEMRRERPFKSPLSLQLQVTFLQAWTKHEFRMSTNPIIHQTYLRSLKIEELPISNKMGIVCA